MDSFDMRRKWAATLEQAETLLNTIESEGRDFTPSEKTKFDNLVRDSHRQAGRIEEAEGHAEQFPQTDDVRALVAWGKEPQDDDPPRMVGPSRGQSTAGRSYIAGTENRTAEAMFGRTMSSNGWKSEIEFINTITSRIADPRLLKELRAMGEGTGSGGGFAVPTEFSNVWMDASLEGEVIRPRASIFPMKSDEMEIPGFCLDHSTDGIYGGINAYWMAEAGTLTESEPKLRQAKMRAKKLTILSKLSNELLADVRNVDQLRAAFVKAMRWKLDNGFFNGMGAGEPLGILNADCLHTVSKQGGQAASTILWENILDMYAALSPESRTSPGTCWMVDATTIPELGTMELTIGTGGSAVWLANGIGSIPQKMLGYDVIVTTHASTLGTKGDIILADLNRYGIGLRQEIAYDTSSHAAFTTDQTYHRLILRADGQPLDDETTTQPDGSTTSPFVVLETRS